MVLHWCLSDSESSQVSRTRLRILAVLSNAVVWIVSTRPPTSKSSKPFYNPLIIVPKAPIIPIMFNHTNHVPRLFQFSSKVEVLILLFTFFQFYSVISRAIKVNNFAKSLFFWLIIVWNELQLALASMSMQTKLNTCALIKQVIFPH